ncbi:hypothetical protein DOTSEDRAFT_167503 [Dothistroma septosporum NZE10]|uniref:Serine/threonine-protein kinase Tel1 n=1 Tax=Dothistroma septosporum (strain NZE10 / CBS 128990) TaxID=675120 RepID=N1PX57_DOTSN|nr:hypothetical protein DOTSEDRAFT_167503 [Dothistroma septosporum NZE10]
MPPRERPLPAEVTLNEAIESVQSSSLTTRKQGLADLKRILRLDSNDARIRDLKAETKLALCQSLFQAALNDRSAYVKAKTHALKSGAANRLGDIASALRVTVEVCNTSVQTKIVKAVIDHITQTIYLPAGDELCEPLALDYAKTLRILLTYQPHVEHLTKEWQNIVVSCIRYVQDATAVAAESNALEHGSSSRSSRSINKESAGSQESRSVRRMVAEEAVSCLQLLTAVPNAPIKKMAHQLLAALIDYLKTSSVSSRAHVDAFAAMNHVLTWARMEDVKLTQDVTIHLMRLVRQFWGAKSHALDQMLIALLLLRPYIFRGVGQEHALPLRPELLGLINAIQSEYEERDSKKQFSLDGLRLQFNNPNAPVEDEICTPLFTLRCGPAEPHWVTVYLLASFYNAMIGSSASNAGSDCETNPESEMEISTRPRKRRRREDNLEELAAEAVRGSPSSRTCALQVLAFLAQQRAFTSPQLQTVINNACSSCSEEAGSVSSWAFLCLAACATQAAAADNALGASWISVWQLACRSLSNASSCRSASFALCVILQLRLVPHANIIELIQLLTDSMDLNGPTSMSDSVSLLLSCSLKAVHVVQPGASAKVAESVSLWLSHNLKPAKFDDKSHAALSASWDASDVINLIAACLGQQPHRLQASGFKFWHAPGRAWLLCQGHQELIAYLLLSFPEDMNGANRSLAAPLPHSLAAFSQGPCENAILKHLTAELVDTNSKWATTQANRGSPQLSHDQVSMLFKVCVVLCCASSCLAFKDSRGQEELRKQTITLLESLTAYTTNANRDQTTIVTWYSTLSAAFTGLHTGDSNYEYRPPACEKTLCRALVENSLHQQPDNHGFDDDEMDSEDCADSQDSRRGKATSGTVELANDFDVAYSEMAMRSNVALYAMAVNAQEQTAADSASAVVADFLLAQSDVTVLSSRVAIALLPEIGVTLNAADSERLLDYFMGNWPNTYHHRRSEVVLGTMLDVVSSLMAGWTDRSNKTLYGLGLDIYDWFTMALSVGFLSPNTQIKLASLLLKLCQIDSEYGQLDNATSVRTNLFSTLSRGRIALQWHLAARISSIFGLFVLSTHLAIFEDLRNSLPDDIEWLEGISMRLLFLSRLAAAWHTLRRECIYVMFETAGLIPQALKHAAHCLEELASQLPAKTTRKLFSMFAPQLLHSWLGNGYAIANLPFAAFQYSSLNDLLVSIQAEACAQFLMHQSEDGMNAIVKALKRMPSDIIKGNFAKCVAYAISYDVKESTNGTSKSENDKRMKDIIGKEDYRAYISQQSPTVLGTLYLHMQQDDPDDTWLAKNSDLSQAADALAEMKQYSYSTRVLPVPQQPFFKARLLHDQLQRVCKRTGQQSTALWTSSSLTLAVRMLLNDIDETKGPLHSCIIIRRLRILVCMAGDIALQDFPLEMLLHSLRPFVSDSECADDTMGVLQYLLHHGRGYLRKNSRLLTGTTILLVLQMSRHARSKQSSTTQETQHTTTLQKMQDFRRWLVKSLGERTDECGAPAAEPGLMNALEQLHLPGNARAGSPESFILLFVLKGRSSSTSRVSDNDALEAVRLLSEGFAAPPIVADDCLGADDDAVAWAQQLWECTQLIPLDGNFRAWASGVLGRAYASTGTTPTSRRQQNGAIWKKLDLNVAKGIGVSQASIMEHLCNILFSKSRREAGLAEYTLRHLYQYLIDNGDHGDEAVALDRMLPDTVYAVVADGDYGYEPASASADVNAAVDQVHLRHALSQWRSEDLETWAVELVTALSRWALGVPIVSTLCAIIQNVPGLATTLLPSITHILLVKEIDTGVLRQEMSAAITDCLGETAELMHTKQQFLLRLLLYLKSQPYPEETTKVDRLQWLDIDWSFAANAGSRCYMPTSALLLAEFAAPVQDISRRSSSRHSVFQSHLVKVPEDLLISIYQQLEEPDSFYGVQQPASLDSLLNRLDHEADGFRSLMFRSAQMDSHMRSSGWIGDNDAIGMARSLSALNFNGLALTLLKSGASVSTNASDGLLAAARTLQQWDIMLPDAVNSDSATIFKAFQALSRASDAPQADAILRAAITDHARSGFTSDSATMPPKSWFHVMAMLTESRDLITSADQLEMVARWQLVQARQGWMQMARYDDIKPLLSNRQTLFGVLCLNTPLQRALHLTAKQCHTFEAEALLDVSRFGREYLKIQDSVSATSILDGMTEKYATVKLKIQAAVKSETASVLWSAGEASASIRMLRDILHVADMEREDIVVGRAGLHAQLGHRLAEARLEKPEDILGNHLKPAITHLKTRKRGLEAGKVFHEFARFCDQELQSSSNRSNLNRITKLRQGKQEEVDAIKLAMRNAKRTGQEKPELNRSLRSAQQWLDIDTHEESRLKENRNKNIQQSLQNYLLALHASETHDICVLRFFALWLESADDMEANGVVLKYLHDVPSWKLVLLMNQLMSRLENEPSTFQKALQELLLRIFTEHPYHSLHHLYAAISVRPSTTETAMTSRYEAAKSMSSVMETEPEQKALNGRIFRADRYYKTLAELKFDRQGTYPVKNYKEAVRFTTNIPTMHVPPATISVPLRPSGVYNDVPSITRFESSINVLGGVSSPKMLAALASDGKRYKDIYKSGNDDLRQDAIMEQVFEEVSKMLRNHKVTRQRDLKVRTYKVVPLTTQCGVIEFVPNSLPINEYLRKAHKRHYPSDYTDTKARDIIASVSGSDIETRVREFRKICERMRPVMRHFFFERFDDPDEWFEKRTAYTRTTASISILGYILGLGDRHCSNILLDEKTGECVHIDLGVAFEAGRILPIPEMVPFRLTRDIVDAMGVTGVEGVFRRCCEFTMDAVREDKDSIMTLLNVLRYDPLYNWSVSPLRAKRMQEAQETARRGGLEHESSSKQRESEAGEADRALSIVEKKLRNTLSTSAAVNELIQQATDEKHLATLFNGWAAFY